MESTLRIPLEDRLKKYSKSNIETGCIEWVGYKNASGYGRLNVRKKLILAHRLAWELANGEIPDGLFVLHKCDNPACITPSHLFLGDNTDNSDDKCKKDRQVKGERHGRSKLVEQEIKKILIDDRSSYQVATDYGVSSSNIRFIRRRDTWKHVTQSI